MKGLFGVLLAVSLLAGCRAYDVRSRVSDDAGLIAGDQFARYGREQAQAVASARQLADTGDVQATINYARALPDVVNVVADPQGYWLTLSFRSGWRTAVPPLDDGKRAAETPNLPAAGTAPPPR